MSTYETRVLRLCAAISFKLLSLQIYLRLMIWSFLTELYFVYRKEFRSFHTRVIL